jgi:uncharacterized Fe-S center protein
MSKVYFIKIDSYSKTKETSEAAKTLLEKIQIEEKVFDFNKPLPIKVHFGEDKNVTYIEPKNFEGIIEYLKKNSKVKPKSKAKKYSANSNTTPGIYYIETNTLYKGKRTTKESHLELAKEHGFTQIPVIIADGEMGEDYELVDISDSNPTHFKTCKIGKKIAQEKQLLVLSHVKGHISAGFGAAIKQLSMGCGARGGKLDMHAKSKPTLLAIKCKKCFTCSKNCPTDACIIDTLIPHVDYSKCIGCAKCIAVCPYGAMQINWMSTGQDEFTEKLAEYALAAQKGKKVIYINFLLNIALGCDCMGSKQKLVAKDIGVLASTDPVALDRACLDLLEKNEHKKLFSGEHTLEHAEKIGLGANKYELIEIK